MKKTTIGLMFAATIFLFGCAASPQMPFSDEKEILTEQSKPIFLITMTIKNTHRTSFQPRLFSAHVEKLEGKEFITFNLDEKAKNETDDVKTGNNYLLRLALDPGNYEIRGLTSIASSFLIRGFFFTPLHSKLTVKEKGVFYLGHINATVRERNNTEFRAGAVLPLVDQAIAGASTGTFEVEITDELATDEVLFRTKFPALAGVTIKKALLPNFDRAKAQAWWETH